jgi:hypothetical protein
VYDWDSQNQTWVDAGSSSNIELNFPASRDASGNNASFVLSSYSDQQVTLGGSGGYLPTAIDADLTVGGTDVFGVDLSNTSFYDGTVNGTQVPQSFDLSILTAPQQHTFAYSSASRSEFSLDFDLAEASSDDAILGILVNLTLNSDFDNVSGASGVDEASGAVDFGSDLTLDYTVDVDGVNSLGANPSADELNNEFTATFNFQGQKLGDIQIAEIEQNGQTTNTPVLVYNDGSREPLVQVFDDTFTAFSGSPAGTLASKATSAFDSVKDAVVGAF